jgi:biotin synthase-like enzyme
MRQIESKYEQVLALVKEIRSEQYDLMRSATINKEIKRKAQTGIDYTWYNLETDYNVYKRVMKDIE